MGTQVFEDALRVGRPTMHQAARRAATELGLWQAVESRAELLRLGTPHKVRALLDVLLLEGDLVEVSPGRYRAEPVEAAPVHGDWARLAEVIRTGLPLDPGAHLTAHHEHLRSLAVHPAQALFADFPDATTLLDLGGGLGGYAEAFVQGRPDRRATLVELPEVAALALQRHEASVQIAVVEHDLLEGAPNVTLADLVLLANVVHLHGPDSVATLLEVATALTSETGATVVADVFLDDDRRGSPRAVYFSLNMALYTTEGRVWTRAALRQMAPGIRLHGC